MSRKSAGCPQGSASSEITRHTVQAGLEATEVLLLAQREASARGLRSLTGGTALICPRGSVCSSQSQVDGPAAEEPSVDTAAAQPAVGPGTGCGPGDELRSSAFTQELGIELRWPRACAKSLRPVCAWAWGASGLDAMHFPSETSLDHPVEAELSEPFFRSVGMVCLQCTSPNTTGQASGAHRAGLAASMDPRTASNTAQQVFLSMLSPLLN